MSIFGAEDVPMLKDMIICISANYCYREEVDIWEYLRDYDYECLIECVGGFVKILSCAVTKADAPPKTTLSVHNII